MIIKDASTSGFGEFLSKYAFPISCIAAGIVFTVVLVFFIIAVVKRKRNPDLMIQKPQTSVEANNILSGLGGKENILAHSLNGSRIVLVLKDYSLVNEEIINSNGVDSFIKMSNKITLVVKNDSSKLYRNMFPN